MEAVIEAKKIDKYVDDFFKKLSYNELRDVFNKIINFEYVKGLDNYSKELLALAVERKIVMSVEKYCQKKQNPSIWKHLKIEAPLIKQKTYYLEEYIDLAIKDLYKPFPKNNNFDDIKSFYDKEIYRSSKLLINRLIALPSGEKVSVNDLLIAVNNTLNNIGIIKKEYDIIDKKEKLKNTAAIAGLITVMGTSLVFNNNAKVERSNTKEISVEKTIEKEVKPHINQEPKSEIIEYNFEPVFVGYQNNCPLEYQKNMLEIAHKYDIPFNLLITIADNESNGLFDSNGVISSTNDYGLCQINICNHDKIYKDLGYTSKDLLNDPYKNIDAAAYLIKNICNIYPDDVLNGNFENVLGAYNGWKNWRNKEISVEYAANGMEKLNTIYNKEEKELYDNLSEELDAKSR